MSGRVLILVAPMLVACHLLLPMQPGGRDQRGSGDGSAIGSELRMDRAVDGAGLDGHPATEPAPQDPCSQTWPAVAAYDFHSGLADGTGHGHDGVWKPQGAPPTSTGVLSLTGSQLSTRDDPTYCNQPGAAAWAALPDSVDWNIARGALSLKVRFDRAPGVVEGIIARDLSGINEGDISLVRLAGGSLGVRLTANGLQHWRCVAAPKVTVNAWHVVRVVFGTDLQLCFDGTVVGDPGAGFMEGEACVPQGTVVTGGIQRGPNRDWVLGATNWCEAYPVYPLKGAIDDLRIEKAP